MNYKENILISLKSIEDSNVNILNNPIILYGAGRGLLTFYNTIMKKYGIRPYAVIDDYIVENKYNIPSFFSNQYIPSQKEKNDSILILTIGSLQYYDKMYTVASGMGFKNIIMASEIYDFQCVIEEDTARTSREFYIKNSENIFEVLNVLEDDLSKEVFSLVMKTHIEKKSFKIPNNSIHEQYFPSDIKLNKGVNNFINCGAYTGDTVRVLNTLYGKINSLACFEPDIHNFNSLIEYLTVNSNNIANNILSLPCGVWNKEEMCAFKTGIDMCSTITNVGNTAIQCVSLDNILFNFNPTFINMDIEGSELNALAGAEKLIIKSKPDLAISIYHYPRHMWEIPLFLSNLNIGYKFYLRNYTSFTNDTILYATI